MNIEMIILTSIVAIMIIVMIASYVISFLKAKKEDQIEIIKNWLLYAVSEAEKIFGGKTGQLKLAEVYNRFVSTFPTLAKMISYERFQQLVDEALVKMRHLIETNAYIEEYISIKQEK